MDRDFPLKLKNSHSKYYSNCFINHDLRPGLKYSHRKWYYDSFANSYKNIETRIETRKKERVTGQNKRFHSTLREFSMKHTTRTRPNSSSKPNIQLGNVSRTIKERWSTRRMDGNSIDHRPRETRCYAIVSSWNDPVIYPPLYSRIAGIPVLHQESEPVILPLFRFEAKYLRFWLCIRVCGHVDNAFR